MDVVQAGPEDLEAVLALLRGSALPTEGVAEHFCGFLVARAGGAVAGCAGQEGYSSNVLLDLSLSPQPIAAGVLVGPSRAGSSNRQEKTAHRASIFSRRRPAISFSSSGSAEFRARRRNPPSARQPSFARSAVNPPPACGSSSGTGRPDETSVRSSCVLNGLTQGAGRRYRRPLERV